MSAAPINNETLLKWATDPTRPVALRLKQTLTSVECLQPTDPCVIYPPTYADIGYNIDPLADGRKVALVDSVGSQANRMEPIFKSTNSDPAKWLVPQIQIALGGAPEARRISLLDLPHRGADAVVKSSGDLAKMIKEAFAALRETGNAGPLCALAPTSLVFGVWDSRGGSSEKRPRLVRSVIRAWDVDVLHAAAQFNSVWKELDESAQKVINAAAGKKRSVLGFADAPATFRKVSPGAAKHMHEYTEDGSPNPARRVLGGVLVRGGIMRDVTINLVALRGLRAGNDAETKQLQQYLLALALLAATADLDLFLREGCHLRYAGDDQWYAVPRRGEPTEVGLTSGDAAKVFHDLAESGAKHFRPKWPKEMNYTFNPAEVKKLLLAAKEEEEAQSD